MSDLEREIAELEKAQAEAAQSDMEPVAWRYRFAPDNKWGCSLQPVKATHEVIVEPLYTAPPRPDASGLLEMVRARAMLLEDPQSSAEMWQLYDELSASARERTET